MADSPQNDNIVFVNLLREERSVNDASIIDQSLRAVERWASQRSSVQMADAFVSKLVGIEPAPKGNAVMHDQVDAFKASLKPGECGVFAHGNSFTIIDDRMNTPPERQKMLAQGLEGVLKAAGCTEQMPVILYSCNTGAGKDSLASELSKYHPTVVAPNGFIAEFITDSRPGIYKGNQSTGEIDFAEPRQWRVFSHGKEIASYDWGSEKIHRDLAHEPAGEHSQEAGGPGR